MSELAAFTVGITVHEFSHASCAFALGDDTGRRDGRLTLNPLRHLDPLGSLLLVVSAFSGGAGFGWGRPVRVHAPSLRGGRRGMALVSLAGPASNLVLATIAMTMSLVAEIMLPTANPLFVQFIADVFAINLGLAAFNLLPLPPLDGFGIALGVLPHQIAVPLSRLERLGPGILLLLIFAPSIIHINILSLVLGPVIQFLVRVVSLVATTIMALFLSGPLLH